jgi:hypothetical protein
MTAFSKTRWKARTAHGGDSPRLLGSVATRSIPTVDADGVALTAIQD